MFFGPARSATTSAAAFSHLIQSAAHSASKAGKAGFGVEPTGTLRSVPYGFAARGEHRLP